MPPYVDQMALNLLKLCVGCDSVEDLEQWITHSLALKKAAGLAQEQFHTTRMVPKRGDELLDGGSLYWVIKGNVQARQKLVGLQPVTGADGIGRVKLMLEPKVIQTQWQPRRPFQGWRYLKPEDAPADLKTGSMGSEEMPRALREELASLGLL